VAVAAAGPSLDGMKLAILRHGRAGDRNQWAGDDRERPLTPKGRKRTEAVLLRLWPQFDLDEIWTSPWLRARQTGEIAARIWKVPLSEQQWLAGDAVTTEDAVRLLAATADPEQALMLVGHEPDLGLLIGHLTGGPAPLLKKAGLAVLDGEPAAGGMLLRALLPPRLVLDLGNEEV